MKKDIIKLIEDYMLKNGEELDKKIQEVVEEFSVKKRKRTEEDFKMAFIPLLNNVAEEIGIELNPLYENTVFRGRIDALYNCVDLEYKVPGAIESANHYNARKSANEAYIEEVQRQIKGYSDKEKVNLDSILGIIFDGNYFIYVHYLSTDWYVSEPEDRNKFSIEKFLKRLFSLQLDNKAVTISNLVNDFGFKSKIAENTINIFYKAIRENINTNVGLNLIFEQWKSLFREVSGYSYDTLKIDLNEIKSIYGLDEEEVKLDYLIFSIHTYYALLIKILVIKILYHHKKQNAFQHGLKYETNRIAYTTMKNIESGGRFKDLGIRNFLEGDFFGWYLNVWDNDIYEVIVGMLKMFDEYNYDTINLDEGNSRDLLKKLYNYLLPRSLRHALGEYYSPDWLAQRTYNLLNLNGDINKSILDPTCGSGTFIVIAIKEIIRNNQHLDKKELLDKIINNIHGFDLNPLAVISARANYIIALGDLLDSTTEEIELPIFHCDAMLTILEQPKGNHIVRKLSTRAGIYEIPLELTENKKSLYQILDIFNKNVENELDFNEELWSKIIKLCPNIKKYDLDKQHEIKELTNIFYKQIEELKGKGIMEVWTQIIKNAFAPIFHEKVDYIIGNPPWVNWQTLPEDYRESIHAHWHNYKIFDFIGLQARLGSAHDDISVLLTYVVMDNFLKDNGHLGFIINQNLLQAHGGGEGFRKFMIREEIPVKVEKVEDFVEVQPFQSLGASNKTAIIIMKKGEQTSYPVDYKKWTRKNRGIIDSDDLLDSVLAKLKEDDMVAEPIKLSENVSSAWIVTYEEELELFKSLVGNSEYRGRKGIDTSANGIYWVNVIEENRGKLLIKSTPENSKKDIPDVTCIIEKDLVYPLVRGRDIGKWRYETPYSIIVPYQENFKHPLDMEEFRERYTNTYNYFYNSNVNPYSEQFVQILKSRGIYTKHYKDTSKKTIPVHVLYNIGEYTKAPYKVVWKTLQSKGMNTCVISSKDGKLVLPDHNNIMVPFDNESEAHYLCAILNSKIIGDFVDAYISWFKSAHILDNIAIPKFDETNEIHVKLAEKSMQAHSEVGLEINSIEAIEKEINELVKEIL
ncbi:Eco57I restriction-modification methylase domain-containing protein [Haloimpatiens lingqiaonensis]|uniref:Eco57I restriction-modification methylase domain-containing protein n=1 Tax=Haloimpatiens lingqiaonensis TaxID=1380675 RepID=UPI0010FE5140|nr:N-6 DNA methylase [Haloimpatiens lingqiaonensis]